MNDRSQFHEPCPERIAEIARLLVDDGRPATAAALTDRLADACDHLLSALGDAIGS